LKLSRFTPPDNRIGVDYKGPLPDPPLEPHWEEPNGSLGGAGSTIAGAAAAGAGAGAAAGVGAGAATAGATAPVASELPAGPARCPPPAFGVSPLGAATSFLLHAESCPAAAPEPGPGAGNSSSSSPPTAMADSA